MTAHKHITDASATFAGSPEPGPHLAGVRSALLDLIDSKPAGTSEPNLMGQLAHLAFTDELTGLPNRRAWNRSLSRELTRAKHTGEPLTIAIIDLDRFKQYNDRYGHQAGDLLLQRAAACWRRELRDNAILARYGGEEFALALSDCRVEQALAAAKRLRGATPSGQTCSIGVAQWNGIESGHALVAHADSALYEAKAAGRDRAIAIDEQAQPDRSAHGVI